MGGVALLRMSAPPDVLDPVLDAPPEAITRPLDAWLHAVREGRLRMPWFQRGFRWTESDQLDLLDSVYRGYPIGTLLLWKRKAPADLVRFHRYEVRAPERADAWWVVDGQQRLATLASTLLVAPSPGERALYFDLDRKRFLWTREAAATPSLFPDAPTLVPASVLLDSAMLVEWFFAHPKLSVAHRLLAGKVGKRLRDFQVPAYSVDTDDPEALRTIFLRINRTGARLNDAEVFHALLVGTQADAPSLVSVARDLGALGWGTLNTELLLLVLQALEDLPIHLDPEKLPRRSASILKPATLDRLRAALVRAIEFLAQEALIPHRAVSPYSSALVVLSRFFDLFPEASLRSRVLLRRWLWRAILARRLTGAVTDLRQHLRALCPDDEHGTVQALLALVPRRFETEMGDIAEVNLATARSRIQLCALATLQPRDLRTGETLPLRSLWDAGDDLLPRLLSKSTGAAGLANRVLHPVLPARLLRDALAVASAEMLSSHAFSEAARDALVRDDGEAFLALREDALRDLLDGFFRRMAEWGADDSPPLDALAVEDDA